MTTTEKKELKGLPAKKKDESTYGWGGMWLNVERNDRVIKPMSTAQAVCLAIGGMSAAGYGLVVLAIRCLEALR